MKKLGPIQPTPCFCRACELKLILTFLNVWGGAESKEVRFPMIRENHTALKHQCPPVTSHWSTAALVYASAGAALAPPGQHPAAAGDLPQLRSAQGNAALGRECNGTFTLHRQQAPQHVLE